MISTIGQLFKFMAVYRKFWLAPVIIVLLLLGALIIAQSTVLAPFIYAIF